MGNQSTGVFSSKCQKCGRTLYEGEMLNIKGKYVCEPCADAFIFRGAGAKKKSVPSPFFHFLFSFHPGAGQMYLGLMKRGLCHMCLFYLCIYLAAVSSALFFGLVIPIVYIYSFFDSLVLRRRIASGENVPDNMGEVVQFLNRNKGLVIIAAVVITIMCFFSGIFMMIGGEYAAEYARPAPPAPPVSDSANVYHKEVTVRAKRGKIVAPLVLICVGGIIIAKASKKKKASGTGDIIEHDDKFDYYGN